MAKLQQELKAEHRKHQESCAHGCKTHGSQHAAKSPHNERQKRKRNIHTKKRAKTQRLREAAQCRLVRRNCLPAAEWCGNFRAATMPPMIQAPFLSFATRCIAVPQASSRRIALLMTGQHSDTRCVNSWDEQCAKQRSARSRADIHTSTAS